MDYIYVQYLAYGLISFGVLFLLALLLWTIFSKQTAQIQVEPAKKTLITRQEIAKNIRSLNEAELSIVEHPEQPQLPMSLKWKAKTYALLYGTDDGILLVARIDNDYAQKLIKNYPAVKHSQFPKGNNWYTVPLNESFHNKDDINNILNNARQFVQKIHKKTIEKQ